jgi:hypothetical protein
LILNKYGVYGRDKPAEIRNYCKIDETGQNLLKTAINKLGLSARAYDRILKVSRTIADLAMVESILPEHISRGHPIPQLGQGHLELVSDINTPKLSFIQVAKLIICSLFSKILFNLIINKINK